MSIEDREAAFLRRLGEHRGILFKVAALYCRDRGDRDDLVQDIVAQLWRSFPKYDARRPFATWMYRIAVNVAISFHRTRTRQTRGSVPVQGWVLDNAATAEPSSDEQLDLLHELISNLHALDRALMMLYLDGNPHATIAEILGISETNVATKIGRIKERMRRNVREAAVGR